MLNTTLYGTGLYDTGAPAVEVRIFRADRLLALELCEDDREAADIVGRWSERDDVSFLIDDIAGRNAEDDVREPAHPQPAGPAHPIAAAPLPAEGTE